MLAERERYDIYAEKEFKINVVAWVMNQELSLVGCSY